MKVKFQWYSPEGEVPHISKIYERDVSTIPRIGEYVIRFQHGTRNATYIVTEVWHCYEDRRDYKNKDYSGEGITVNMELVPDDIIHAQHRAQVARATNKGA